jgi:hypothetical protein
MTTALAFIALATAPERIEVTIPGQLPKFTMVKVPAGSIAVRGKQVQVKPFFIATTELTWNVYDIFLYRLDLKPEDVAAGNYDVASRPSKPYGAPDRGFGHDGFPAIGMTAMSAQKFCDWLSQKTGKKFRLPTEAEWEYAARAGSTELPKPLADYAWHWDNTEDQTEAVGTKKPNAWGLHDTLGNVGEWALGLDGVPVQCGGTFQDKADKINFTSRQPYDPEWQARDAQRPKSRWWLSDGPQVGMRVVMVP